MFYVRLKITCSAQSNMSSTTESPTAQVLSLTQRSCWLQTTGSVVIPCMHSPPKSAIHTYICNWQRFSIRSSQRHQRRHNKSAGQLACWPAINQATCFEGHSSVLPGPFGSTILTYVRTPPSFSVRVLITIALTKHITKSDNTTRLRYLAMCCQTN